MATEIVISITFNRNSNPTENSNSRFLNFNDLNNPYRLDNRDNPVVILVAYLLTGENYVPWSRSMRRALRARNKIGFINSDFQRPTDPVDPLLDAWECCNAKQNRIYYTFCKTSGHTLEICFKARNVKPPICTHCNMKGHLTEKCYRLHSFPPGHELYGKEGVDEKVALTKNQYQQLLSLLENKDTNTTTNSVNQAQTFIKAASTSSNMAIKLPDGSEVPITHIGNVKLFEIIDLPSWTTIGMGEAKHDLYHLKLSGVAPSTLSDRLSKFHIKNLFTATSIVPTLHSDFIPTSPNVSPLPENNIDTSNNSPISPPLASETNPYNLDINVSPEKTMRTNETQLD
ncbi:Retrotransposon Copia-like, N-terminal [Dillenia turbinata]|uniref:Retrotransposon Copia-like, N-terminal n=1 Tax=Dillenia turbinata TaxID=194707 RepID=A0AAN8UN00_9MAGN